MKARKERLTVTVDRALVRAANEAVAAGRASSLSSWVNLALEERATKERRLLALADAVAAYEAKFGEISPEELVQQAEADRTVATRAGARSKPSPVSTKRRRRRAA